MCDDPGQVEDTIEIWSQKEDGTEPNRHSTDKRVQVDNGDHHKV